MVDVFLTIYSNRVMSLVFLQNQSIIPLLHRFKLNTVSLPDSVSLSLVILAVHCYALTKSGTSQVRNVVRRKPSQIKIFFSFVFIREVHSQSCSIGSFSLETEKSASQISSSELGDFAYLFDLPPGALIKFLELNSGHLFEVGAYTRLGAY